MKKLISLCSLLIACLILNAQDTPQYKEVVLPEGFTRQLDVVYTKVNDWEGRMDIYAAQRKRSYAGCD
jgi:hypothetical protein